MCACRKDLFRGKVALRVDGNLMSSYPNSVARRYAVALHLDRAAAERYLLAHQVILAVSCQQLALRRLLRLCDIFGRLLPVESQRPRIGFVEITLRVVGAQKIFEFAGRARENIFSRLPYRKTCVVDGDDPDRRGL